ncbi:MAG: FimV/HubP family polar landmark protein, partial [Candidatus Competibacter sp.]|nr:FimV/HubP family polar landmark protein [Candidatus Competibacter sp.]
MARNVLRCWLASLLLGSACALALEVGEIQVDSSLNQLFDATIPLPMLSPEELGRISVKVASPTMFKEFGLDRGATLDNLVFSIQYDAEGKVYVKVVSIKPIHEPSLALLLEFGWPRGKTFREFTVLLDPVRRLVERPVGRSKTVLDTPTDAGTESNSEPPSADIVVNRTIQYPDRSGSSPEASSAESWVYRPGDVYGPVVSGEGLWGIALKVRPDPGITRDQMMQALFQANPEAFTKAGIDGLRSGVLLRIPTFREIADFTGSSVAKQLAAAAEQATTEQATAEQATAEQATAEQATAEQATKQAASAVDGSGSDMASVGEKPTKVTEPLAGADVGHLAVFPLPRPAALEPAPPVAEPAEVAAAEPKPETVNPEPAEVTAAEPKPEVPEPAEVAAAEPKPEVPTPEPVAVIVPEPQPEVPEPAEVTAAEPKPEVPEPAMIAAAEPKPEVPEPAVIAAAEP